MKVTYANNPKWANEAETRIELTVQFESLPDPVQFLASPDDSTAHGVLIYNNAAAGIYGTVAGYVAPPPSVPSQITTRQFLIAAAFGGIITQQEAIDAATTGAVPALIDAVFSQLSEEQEFAARVTWAKMTIIPRDDALVEAVGTVLDMSSEELDEFFITAGSIP